MKQAVRRLAYLVAGVAPAIFVMPMAYAFGGLVFAGAIAGAVGLLAATALSLPTSPRTYWCVAAFLAGGLAAMLPFSLPIVYGTLADLVTGSTGVSLNVALQDLAARAWGFAGPVLCAVHFLWKARCAPNNSFKPNPLRGSA